MQSESSSVPEDVPIVVVVAHPGLRQREDLHTIFAARQGFVLLPSFQPDSIHQVPSGYLQTVILADAPMLTSESALRVRGIEPMVKVLVLGPGLESASIADYIFAGAVGFLDEDSSPSLLRKAVKAVAKGEYWASRQELASVVRKLVDLLPASKLTPRELEIVGLLAAQHNNRTIASSLGITYDTVRWHLRSIYAKLGVKGRSEVGPHAENELRRMGARRANASQGSDPVAGDSVARTG